MRSLFHGLVLLFCFTAAVLCAAPRTDEGSKQAKTFTVSKGGTLEVDVTLGNLRIQTADKSEVTVRYAHDEDEEGDGDEVAHGVRISQRGNVIRVTTDYRWPEYNDVDFDITV